MSRILTIVRQYAMCLTISCFVIGSATSALAVPPNEVLQFSNFLGFTGSCCSSFGVSVQVTEPAKPAPVVVTWSSDYEASDYVVVGMTVNGGPCIAYGPGAVSPDRVSRTFQWVIFPGDGLIPGTNIFTLCGGGAFGNANFGLNVFTNSTNALAVRLSN